MTSILIISTFVVIIIMFTYFLKKINDIFTHKKYDDGFFIFYGREPKVKIIDFLGKTFVIILSIILIIVLILME
jgi:hypothetical protein